MGGGTVHVDLVQSVSLEQMQFRRADVRTFSISWNGAPFPFANSQIWSGEPDSCAPNWLHGKARTTSPLSA